MIQSFDINNCVKIKTNYELLKVLPDLKFATIPELSIYPDPYFAVNSVDEPDLLIECLSDINIDKFNTKVLKKGCKNSYLYLQNDSFNKLLIQRKMFGRQIVFSLSNLECQKTHMTFNSNYSKILKLTVGRWFSIGKIVNDVLFIKLLSKSLLPLHCGATSINGYANLFLGHPEVGKTSTVTLLVKRLNHDFISQDVALVDGEKIIPIEPTSILKLSKSLKGIFSSLLTKYTTSNLHLVFNPFKNRPINYESNKLFLQPTKIRNLFFLERGAFKLSSLDDEEAFNKIFKLNRLEFNYLGNNLLLAYDVFNDQFNLMKYVENEKNILRNIIRNADNIYQVSTTTLEQRYKVLHKILS